MVCTPKMRPDLIENSRRVLSAAIRLLQRREPYSYAWAEPTRLLTALRLQICGLEKVKRETPVATP